MDRRWRSCFFRTCSGIAGPLSLALLLVTVITGSKLVVPYLSSRVIDRSLVKTGFCVHLNKVETCRPPMASFDRLVDKSNYRSTTPPCFLFQPQLSKLSKKEVGIPQGAWGAFIGTTGAGAGRRPLPRHSQKKSPTGAPAATSRKYGVSILLLCPQGIRTFHARRK
jgi:hypothetical protein